MCKCPSHLVLNCPYNSRAAKTVTELMFPRCCSPSCLQHMDLHAGLFVFLQDVVTVYRTAVAIFPLLASPMGIQLTCTASGEYLSHQVKR